MINLYQRLVLPADSNHRNTLYAGSLLRMALEAGYATAWQHAGPDANLALRSMLNLECLAPVPVGTVAEIESVVLHRAATYIVIGMYGKSLVGVTPWMQAIMVFAQIDNNGQSALFGTPDQMPELPQEPRWVRLQNQFKALMKQRKQFKKD